MKTRLKHILLLGALILTACSRFGEFTPQFEVFVLFPAEGLGDRSFADMVYEGTEYALSKTDASVQYVIPDDMTDGEEWIRNIPALAVSTPEPALIIIAGAQYGQVIDEMSGNFEPHRVIFFGQSETSHPSLAVMDFRTYAPSWIGGYLSASLKPGARSVIIAGMDAPFLKDYEKGFTQGVLDAGGTIADPVYLSSDFSGFEMPDSAYRLTTSLLDQYDLVFALSAGSNFGIVNACRDYPSQRYAVGIDADQSWMGRTVVTGSVIKDFGQLLNEYFKNFSKGIFEGGNFMESMESGSTDFLINPLLIDPESKSTSLIKTAIQKEQDN